MLTFMIEEFVKRLRPLRHVIHSRPEGKEGAVLVDGSEVTRSIAEVTDMKLLK